MQHLMEMPALVMNDTHITTLPYTRISVKISRIEFASDPIKLLDGWSILEIVGKVSLNFLRCASMAWEMDVSQHN